MPIAHGEGRYVIDQKEYKNLKKNKQIAFTYTKGEICKFQDLEANPNGADHDIAGILAYNGRVLGLMPHPERTMFFHHSPMWQMKKQRLYNKKEGLPAKALASAGAGIILFKNAINYFRK